MNSINRELKMIDDDIYLSNLEVYRLQKQVDTLRRNMPAPSYMHTRTGVATIM
ncbi:MAG: hypothetical protein WDO71_11830 [Bacteroidota bacterium]